MPPKAGTWCNHRDSAATEAAAADFHGMDGVNVIGAFQATPALLPLCSPLTARSRPSLAP